MSDNESNELWTQASFTSDDDVGSIGTTHYDVQAEPIPPKHETPRAIADKLVRYVEENLGNVNPTAIAVEIILSEDDAAVVRALPQALIHANIDCVDLFSLVLASITQFSHVNLHAMVRALSEREPSVKN